jgi:hypothetical protein
MRFEAEQFELNLQEENYRLKQENKLLREQFCKVSEAIHLGQTELALAVGNATEAIYSLQKNKSCQAGNGLA